MRIGLYCTAALFSLALLHGDDARAGEGRSLLIAGLDGKTFFRPEGSVNGPNGNDGLAIIDIANPARPRLAHVVKLDTSVYGPPTNLQIAPNGRLGLVTNPVTMRQEGENWWAQPDDRLHVVDLAAEPPSIIETIRVGRQPSGLAIAKSGDVALVANRESRSVSVLSIQDRSVRVVTEIDVGAEIASVAIAPDGRRVYVAKNKAGTVGVLTEENGQWRHDPALDMPVGPGTYGLEVTPDGAFALSGNAGPKPSDGHADTVALIRAGSGRPVVLDHIGVGDTAETLAISPNGRHAAVAVVKGSAAPEASPAYTPDSAAVLVAIQPEGRLSRLGEAPAGAVVQGIAFDPSGGYVYIGNYTTAAWACIGSRATRSATRASVCRCRASPPPSAAVPDGRRVARLPRGRSVSQASVPCADAETRSWVRQLQPRDLLVSARPSPRPSDIAGCIVGAFALVAGDACVPNGTWILAPSLGAAAGLLYGLVFEVDVLVSAVRGAFIAAPVLLYERGLLIRRWRDLIRGAATPIFAVATVATYIG